MKHWLYKTERSVGETIRGSVRDYSNNAIDALRECVLVMSLTFRAPYSGSQT